MIDQHLIQRAEQAFSNACGVPFEKLLAPIEGKPGAGQAAANGSFANAIRQSRAAEDASLPMGAFQRELRRADWDKVMHISCDALVHHGKDLQVAAWLLEAQIHRHGFAAIAGGLYLMTRLCEQYWDDIHPQSTDGTYERRASIFNWIDRKLTPILRQVPLAFDRQGQSFILADWERARRHERLRQTDPDGTVEGASSAELSAALSAVADDSCADVERDLADALAMLKHLSDVLEPRLDEGAPSFSMFAGVMEQARALIEAELERRGVPRHAQPSAIPVESAVPAAPEEATATPVDVILPQTAMAEPAGIRDRAEAYALLEQAANFLQRDDPHSPVPYLVRRAVQWGKLSTTELYQELFLHRGAQINIFDLMGMDASGQTPGKD
ncbi:type VI secretion system protein TssA [Massilia sp. CFBP9026]|uniref:type VI secretion system protein TssA n=1 Tax=Massilia sp. CFBP9026 TaxID=3096536 RepID=UPI002A6B3DB4|nr:type VI secretion system protein TssA [Massilia sp. CFBP9026]MDY0963266.1 type VI secretion system protein TssA [Massilia sp. CFBP9026]